MALMILTVTSGAPCQIEEPSQADIRLDAASIDGILVQTYTSSFHWSPTGKNVYLLLNARYFDEASLKKVFSGISAKLPLAEPLFISSYSNETEMQNEILRNNAGVFAADQKLESTRALGDEGRQSAGTDHQKRFASYYRDKDSEFFELFLDKPFRLHRVNLRQPTKTVPTINVKMQRAIDDGDLTTVKSLIGHGFFVNKRDQFGLTLLMNAAMQAQPRILEYLLSIGAELDATAPSGESALMLAVKKESSASVELLLASGANPHLATNEGETALFIAVEGENVEIVRLLLKAGADPNSSNQQGGKPLMFVEKGGQAQYLLTAGADLNAVDENGWNALLWAISRHRPEVVKVLLASGINPDLVGKDGATARGLAQSLDPQTRDSILVMLSSLMRPRPSR
jgi:ankyrin repeat protein